MICRNAKCPKNRCLVYRTTQVQDISTAINLTTDRENIPDNLEIIILKICQDIPKPKKIVPVDWSINSTVYNIYTKSGNLLMSDQLRKGATYKLVYGNNPKHFLITNCQPLPKTEFCPTDDDGEYTCPVDVGSYKVKETSDNKNVGDKK